MLVSNSFLLLLVRHLLLLAWHLFLLVTGDRGTEDRDTQGTKKSPPRQSRLPVNRGGWKESN